MIVYLLISLIRFMNKVKWSVLSVNAALVVDQFQKIDLKRLFSGLLRERCFNIDLQEQLCFQF